MLDDFMKSKTRAFSSDDILNALGLARRPTAYDSAMPVGLAFIAGLAAGAGAALLLAPKSGRETRQDLANAAAQLTNKATELSNKATELTGRLTSAASEVASDVRAALPLGESERRNADATRTLGGTNRTS
jgi:gas vesicle protein